MTNQVLMTDTLDSLVAEAEGLITSGRRAILGITGAPGSGKSTLGEALAAALGDRAVLVSMDGFHLAQEELERLGRTARKGASDTFDVFGFVDLIRRLVSADEPVVYAPRFNRDLEEPIACSVPAHQLVPLIITEGNYLLLDTPGWAKIAEMLDASWYVDPGEESRVERLIARHVAHGRSPQDAKERSLGSDQVNAELIATTRDRATRVVNPANLPHS